MGFVKDAPKVRRGCAECLTHGKAVQRARASQDPKRYADAVRDHRTHIRAAHYPSGDVPALPVQLAERIEYGRTG